MNYLEHPMIIEECKQNLDAALYENNLNNDVNLPSINKKIDRNDKNEYWPTSIK